MIKNLMCVIWDWNSNTAENKNSRPAERIGGAFCYGKGLKINFFYYKNLFILAVSLHLDISECFEVITVGVSKVGFVQVISAKSNEHLSRIWVATAVLSFWATLFEVHIQFI